MMTKRYRASFSKCLRIAFRALMIPFSGLVLILLVVSVFKDGLDPAFHVRTLLLMVLFVAGLIGVIGSLLFIIGLIWRVTITPETLRCSTYWGVYKTVSWASIQTAHLSSAAGVPYLILESTESTADLWLPLWLAGYDDFLRHACSYGGKDGVFCQLLDLPEEVH